MLGAVFQLPAQEIHQAMFPVRILHQVIQEDLIGSVHHGKVLCLKGRQHIHHLHPLQVLHTVVVDHQH